MRKKKGRSSRWIALAVIVFIAAGIYAATRPLFTKDKSQGAPLAAEVIVPSSPVREDPPTKPDKPLLLVTDTSVLPSIAPTTRPTLTTQPTIKPDAPTLTSPASLSDARQRYESGDLVTARRIYNDLLVSSRLSPDEIVTTKETLSKINDALVFSRKAYTDDPFGGTITVQTGQKLQSIAAAHNLTWEFLARVNGITDPRRLRAFQTLKIIRGPFHAVVTKSAFTMDLFLGAPGGDGSIYIRSFPVGLGKDDSTPTGTWQVEPHKKIKNPTYFSPRGEGIMAADDPKNPLGEFWIGLTGTAGSAVGKQSYGIHGTIEPDSIGKQESMGCVRLRNEDIATVFELLVEGKSTVIVRD